MALIYNASFDSTTRVLSLLDKAGNVISSCEVPSKGNVDDITKPLTFRATQDGSTVKLWRDGAPSGTFQTSRDGGSTWVDYTLATAIPLNTGDEVSFRAKSNRTSAQNVNDNFSFKMEGEIEAWHNAMSMYRTNDFATYNTTVSYAFYGMFRRCTSLVKAPVLTATTLANDCYNSMFHSCTSLVNAPVLPATTLANNCYYSMFSGCTSLVKAPVLTATTLANGCYNYMFNGCTSLVNAPVLPATTLSVRCYDYMFAGCTSLTKSPVLTATTLAQYCYAYMFKGCSNLNEVRCNIPSSYSSSDVASYATDWLSNVSSTGTFYTNEDAKWTTNSSSGIPTGWTRVNEVAPSVDDPNKPLMLRAIEDNSSVTLNKNGTLSNTYQTSTNGTDWTSYTLGTKISLNKGDYVYFRRRNNPTLQSNEKYVQFVMTGKIEAWHNAYSMIKQSFTDTGASVGAYGMINLFRGCASLMKAPLLVNTLLEDRCYANLFNGCTSLTQAPSLPATTLAVYCYYSMFDGCTSLTQAPSLPATTLAKDCYSNMFNGCTSLTQAPSLPATTLANRCYSNMFNGCTSLTQAPSLPATTLVDSCYYDMFSGCTALKEVRISATTTATNALDSWLENVSATGDFYCDPNAKIFPTGSASGIPKGWRRVDVDDPNKPLMLRAIENNSSVMLDKNGTLSNTYQTSTDGTNWTDYTFGNEIILNKGDYVYFRCSNHPTTQSNSNYVQFVMTGKIEAWHNAYSMISSSFTNTEASVGTYGMTRLFKGCESLTKAPLFLNTLATSCYYGTFSVCTSLTSAPQLPATTLATDCYTWMFHGCTSLTSAPQLPATTIAPNCYANMFNGCSKLKEVRVAATTTATNALYQWLSGVSATGDFYCDPNATIFPSGSVSGIPQNWTRKPLSDYPVTP